MLDWVFLKMHYYSHIGIRQTETLFFSKFLRNIYYISIITIHNTKYIHKSAENYTLNK